MFVTRLISGIVLVAIALLAFIFGGEILLGISVFISIAGYLELCRAVGVKEKDKKINALEIVGIIGILAYYAVLYFFPAACSHVHGKRIICGYSRDWRIHA